MADISGWVRMFEGTTLDPDTTPRPTEYDRRRPIVKAIERRALDRDLADAVEGAR